MTKYKEQTLNHLSSFLKIPLFYWWQVWFLHSPLLLFYIFKVQFPFLVSSLTYHMILSESDSLVSVFLFISHYCCISQQQNTLHPPLLCFQHGLNFFSGLVFLLLLSSYHNCTARTRQSKAIRDESFWWAEKEKKVAAVGQKNIKPIKGRVIREGFGDIFDGIKSILLLMFSP